MIYQIKVFNGSTEDEINEWLRNHPEIQDLTVKRDAMHDNFSDGALCNQWTDTTITYRINADT